MPQFILGRGEGVLNDLQALVTELPPGSALLSRVQRQQMNRGWQGVGSSWTDAAAVAWELQSLPSVMPGRGNSTETLAARAALVREVSGSPPPSFLFLPQPPHHLASPHRGKEGRMEGETSGTGKRNPGKLWESNYAGCHPCQPKRSVESRHTKPRS